LNTKATRVFIHREFTDMRKGHNGLSYLVTHKMNLKLLSGAIFLFVGRNRKSAKALVWDATTSAPAADEMVKLIDDLYDIEHEAKDFDDLRELRKTKSTPKVEEIEKWIKDKKGKYLENSSIGKAIKYITPRLSPIKHKGKIVNTKNKGAFKEFLSNPYIPIDNNMAERAQIDPVMGRNNFYGFRSLDGADIGMTLYTLIGTCKKLGIIPRVYLLEMAIRALKEEKLLTPFQYGKMIQESRGVR